MMPKQFVDQELSAQRAHLAFHVSSAKGILTMVDSPQPYDPAGTVVAVIIDVDRSMPMIRCALTRQQAKNLAGKLMECM